MENIKLNDWIEKYKPKKTSDLIGNYEGINEIKNWINTYNDRKKVFLSEKKVKKTKKSKKIVETNNDDVEDNNEQNNSDTEIDDIVIASNAKTNKKASSLTIIGNHGIGKTSIVTTIINELGYNVELINMCNFTTNKNIGEKINKILKGTNIFDSFNTDNENNKKIIVIDEVETISIQAEKKFIEQLVKNNDENWYFPIIFISSLKHYKLMSYLKISTSVIKLNQPTMGDIETLMKIIVVGEKMKFDKMDTIKSIINYVQFDFRRLIYILYDLNSTYKNKKITLDDLNEYYSFSKKKDVDIEIYKCTSELLSNYQNMNECLRLYSGEKVIIPLMIHQNYPRYLYEDVELNSEIAESISTGDIIENYIYSEQNWDMHQVHCFYTCILPSYKLSKRKNKRENNTLNFPSDLNRTSIKKINKKNITNARVYLKNMDINDFLYANTLSKKLIIDKKYEECAKLYREYGAKTETIVSVLKIDKIDTNDTMINDPENIEADTIPKNIKKIFSKLL